MSNAEGTVVVTNMQAGAVMLLAILAFTAVPAQSQTVRDPAMDAHIVRRPRGDIVDLRSVLPDVHFAVPYVAPYRGWRYSRLRVGDRLRPAFYAPRYVVAAPRGLPAAGGDRRWIRYGNDMLLVGRRDGRVFRVVGGRYG